MSVINNVSKTMVTKGNAAVLAAGSDIEDLTPGGVGVFDAKTNKSIDGTTAVDKFYLAVGVDDTGNGTIDDIRKSAGQFIQGKEVSAYSFKPHSAGQPQIMLVSDYKGKCETEFALKVEFRNQEIYRTQGSLQFTKNYVVKTSCCEDCIDCPTGDGNEVTNLMVNAVNTQKDGLLIARAVAAQALTIATHGTSVDYAEGDTMTEEDVSALITYNNADGRAEADKVYTNIEIETIPSKVNKFCDINTLYFNPRQTTILVGLSGGFSCNGTLTETQETAFEEGNGYDIKQREYTTLGFEDGVGPYRVSQLNSLAKGGYEYLADSNEKYDQFSLTYAVRYKTGWQEGLMDQDTVIAVPATSTVTRDSLVIVLDRLLTPQGFDALADDVATASTDPAVVEDANAPETDGLA